MAAPAVASAQHVNSDLWVTNSSVNATAVSGNTLYIGGNFTYVGPATGGGVPFGAGSGTAVSGFPRVHGTVRAVAPDGSGGWFVGGFFDSVGNVPRANLAHILSNFTVASWSSGTNGTVRAIAATATNVYVGGDFTSAGGQTRPYVASMNATTGVTTGWNPNADNPVYGLVLGGSVVYACGIFTNIGGAARSRIAALDVSSGLATSWNPDANSPVFALAMSGSTMYAGGVFSTIGGQSRNCVAALSTSTGLATGWNPNSNDYVYALAVRGSTVYVGGAFFGVGGQTRYNIAAIDSTSGLATSWNPGANTNVLALAVSGSTVYAGGQFTIVGGQNRNYVAAIDAVTGAPTSWDPNAQTTVNAIATSGSTVYIGGAFVSIGGKNRKYIAALDLTTGQPTNWNPNADNSISALAVSGATVYASGNFLSVGGQSRSYLAALDATTGLATGWNPGANGPVNAFALRGTTVYAGGAFTFIGGQSRSYLAALDSTSGAAASWNANVNSYVQCLALSGSTLYAGGYFTAAGGQTRNYAAALDVTTALATSWNPNSGSSVFALAIGGSAIYVGGAFTTIGGQARGHLAALDPTTGLATGWNPTADNTVYALAINGSTVFASGSFFVLSGLTRPYLGAIHGGSGSVTAWNPSPAGNTYCLSVSGSTVYAGGGFPTVGGVPAANIAAISASFGIGRVEPDRGGNAGPVTVVLQGYGFQSGAAVKLVRSGQSDIVGSPVKVATNGDSLAVTFDLSGKAPGGWDIVVTNVDASFASYAGAFTIEAAAAPQLRVDIIGSALTRSSRRTAYDIVIDNPGNVDASYVPLWITGIPSGATVELDFPLAYPPQAGGEPNWSAVPLTFTNPGGKYLPIVIPRVPPGATSRRIYLTIPVGVPSFLLRAAAAPPWVDGNKLRACLAASGVVSNPTCVGGQLTANNAYLASHLEIGAMSGIGVWAKIAFQCEGATALASAVNKAKLILDFVVNPIEFPNAVIPSACNDVLPGHWRDSLLVTIVGAIDPNEKLGARDTLAVQQAIPYSIRFENLSSATAPAQQVVVSDPLSLATLNPATVSLDAITFGNIRIVPPPGLRSYATQVDLRPAKNLLVNVSAAVDLFTGVLSWYFSSIDPATGQPPADPLAGFLPPNVTPPEGEGSMLFTVLPKNGLAGGTQISNTASITFDDNPAIVTGAWLNTVDGNPPASHVMPLAATSDQSPLNVSWTTEGAPPQDLRDYTVYLSEDGAPYRVWRLNTKSVADTLVPPGNHVPHTYAFYSVARDLRGNIEAAPQSADATTLARTGVDDGRAWRLALAGARPNPTTSGVLHVWFTLENRNPAAIEVMDIAGRRVARRDVGSLGPGQHSVLLADSRSFRPGLYFIRLIQGERVLHDRVAVIR